MNEQDSKKIHEALSVSIRQGIQKYGYRLLLSFSDRRRNAEEKKAA